jgi:phage terminase large subunit
VVLSGPAGTGKSRAILEKIYLCALKWPGSRWAICRKTRVSLVQSGLVTFEEKVVPAGAPWVTNMRRAQRLAYYLPNGSEIVVAGLDEPTRLYSTEFDGVYVQECTELLLAEWESLLRALRNGVMPFQQLLGDCNPDRSNHWLLQRSRAGRCRMLESAHEDNPALWDRRAGRWTEPGAAYLATLERLTGVRYLRLRKGLWVSAEGLVYDEWDARLHLVARSAVRVGNEWPRYWVVDFGYTDPFCWQEWVRDPDGRVMLLREIYRTGRLVEDHAAEILRATGWKLVGGRLVPAWRKPLPLPRVVLCDHDAEDRRTFERHTGLATEAAWKDLSTGIQGVKRRLRKAGDGRPRLLLVRDALIGDRDPSLAETARPCCTAEEVEGYVWAKTAAGEEKPETPVDKDNHGMDCMRYLCAHVDDVADNDVKFWGGD